ncbi:hypothetical protein TWF173_001767 [Orbilia oligospora]|nr:hypothetical protein TWF173_001767 [Orbilia oligospora]
MGNPSPWSSKYRPSRNSSLSIGALSATSLIWSSTRNLNISSSAIANKITSVKDSISPWLPSYSSPREEKDIAATLELPASPNTTHETNTTTTATVSPSIFPAPATGLRRTSKSTPFKSYALSKQPRHPFLSIMDDFVVQAYPYAKVAVNHASAVLAHALKIVYPILNNLYNQNPTLVSIVLLVSAVYFVLRIVTKITNFIWSVTRNIFQLFFVVGVVLACMNYYNKRSTGKLGDDGNVIPGFDWDATWADFQGVWGFVQNIGAVLMDLVESGSNLEEDGWNSGRRKTMGMKGDGLFAERPGNKKGEQKWR